MTTRITPRLREQAAQLLSAAASNAHAPCESMETGNSCLACCTHTVDVSNAAFLLAHAAWVGCGFVYAEAECLLRCGWCPEGWSEQMGPSPTKYAPIYGSGSQCGCCGRDQGTGGCFTCNSSRIYCSQCGSRTRCGCGAHYACGCEHGKHRRTP
jgi:hypothetical protein